MNTTRTLKGLPKEIDRMENLFYEQKTARYERHKVHGCRRKASGKKSVSDKRRQMKIDSIRYQELMTEAM